MQICTNMSCLRHCQGRLMLFFFGGGGRNVYNVMLHVNAATPRGLTALICVLYNVLSENYSVQNFPLIIVFLMQKNRIFFRERSVCVY